MERSPARQGRFARARKAFRRALETTRRAFAEFLAIPTAIIAGFLGLAVLAYLLDEARTVWAGPNAGLLGSRLFSDPGASVDLLGTSASGIITVTSITFSLLLIAVQQGAASLTSEVLDQFLRRKTNQFYFGFFLGLALYCLVVLATITSTHTPTYGAALGLLMTIAALYMLILLIYTTVDQMRPAVIIEAIHDHTLAARQRQRPLLRDTRRLPRLDGATASPVIAESNGFLVRVDTARLAEATRDLEGRVEIRILPSIGDTVSFHDTIAEIRMPGGEDVAALRRSVLEALVLESQRDLDTDPSFGIDQLAIIGWTSASSAKSSSGAALQACWSLRDILARWTGPDEEASEPPLPVVYPDNVPDRLLQAFESLLVVASESMQYQTTAEVYRALAAVLPRCPILMQAKVEALVLRSLAALGDHMPTQDLDAALSEVADALGDAGRAGSAEAVRVAQRKLPRAAALSTPVRPARDRPHVPGRLHRPVRMRSTSSFAVGMNPFE